MSLADCITKMGKALSKQDADAIQSYVDNGMDELEAIDLHLATMDAGTTLAQPSVRGAKPLGDFKAKSSADNTLVVYGDIEEIRAEIPEGLKGTPVPGGLRFTPNVSHRIEAALRGEPITYSRAGKVVRHRKDDDGKYIGASQANNTAAKMKTWRGLFKQLATEGERGRFWYESSGAEIYNMTGGNMEEAKKFVALLAIYSPQAKVDANSTFALRAWAQYKAGVPIEVKTGVQDRQASELLYEGKAWGGEKTNNFYSNLLREVDPNYSEGQGATIDMWMMRAGLYDHDAPTASEYAFMENETNRLAEELGWEPQQVQAAVWVGMKARMENKGVKKKTEAISKKKKWIKYNDKGVRVVLDKSKHALNWVKRALEHDLTEADTTQAKFDFSDGVRRHIGQMSWEAIPSVHTDMLPGIHNATYEQLEELQIAIQEALSDENGGDLIAHYLGILADGSVIAPGMWENAVSPSSQIQMPIAAAGGGVMYVGEDGAEITKRKWSALSSAERKAYTPVSRIEPAQAQILNMHAAMMGLLLRQDGVGYHKPFFGNSLIKSNGVDVRLDRPLTPVEMRKFADILSEKLPGLDAVSTPDGLRVVNFDDSVNNRDLHEVVKSIVKEDMHDDFEAEIVYFTSDGALIQNNWKENSNGQDYQRRISEAGRSDFLRWGATVLYPKTQAVYREFAEKYGWGEVQEIQWESQTLAQSALTETPAFKNWAGTDEVLEPHEVNQHDFSGPGPYVMKAYHGTTHDFTEFDASIKGNTEGQFGAVNYFTTDEYDASQNYAGTGPDLTNRIIQEQEHIQQWLEDDLGDVSEENRQEFLDAGVSDDAITSALDLVHPNDAIPQMAGDLARERMVGGEEQVLEVFIRTDKPFVVGTESSPFIEFQNLESFRSDAEESIAGSYGIEKSELAEEHEDDIQEEMWALMDQEDHPLYEAIMTVASRYEGLNAAELWGEVSEHSIDSTDHDALESVFRAAESLAYVEDYGDGGLVGYHILGQIIQELGFDSIILTNAQDRFASMDMDGGTAHIHVFDENNTNIKSAENLGAFDPTDPNIYAQQDRATIELKANGERIIRLSKSSDPSSFLHESAHLFLEMEKQMAAEFGIHKEQQAVLDWLGVESFDDVTVDMHEKYAETFEKYLETGKAPSFALRDAFAAFRRWLVNVYRSMDPRTRANLTPEITEYFNRMLATDAEIAAVQGDATAQELFQSADQAGMTDSQWEKYQEQKAKRDSVATATLDAKLISELKSRYTEEWNDEKRPLVEEAKDDLRKRPAYAILADAATSPMNHAMVAELNGGKIPGNMIGKATKDGVDPAEYAEVYGYPSAAAMIKDIAATPKLSEAADQAAQEVMIARHGDILNDGTIEREARDAMHNDEQIKLLLMEMKALRPQRAGKLNREYLKAEAKRMIGGMKYSKIQPSKFYRAEIAAAKRAAEATTDEERYAAKTQQAANHYLYREAVNAKAAMDRHRKYVRRVQTKAYSTKQVDARYVQNMKAIANMYDLRTNPEKVLVASQVIEWYQAQINDANQYVDLALLDMSLLNALALKEDTGEIPEDFSIPTFDDLTADDMRGLYDQLRHLRFIGGQLSDEVKAELAAKRLALSESIIDNGGKDKAPASERGLPTTTTNLKRNVSHLINKIPSLRNLIRTLDGFDPDGAAARMIFALVEKGNSNKLNLQTEFYERYDSAMDDIHKVGLSKSASDKKVYIKEDGGAIAMHSENRFMLALYWGTETSREAVRQGWGLTDADVAKIMSDLTASQLELVNTTWAVNETLWPQLSEASVKQYGVAPPKLDPTPFVVNGVSMTGGHQRLFYDSSSIELQSDKELAGSQSDIMPTKAGSLHSRVGSGGKPPLLDRNNIARAVDDSIHFIAFAEVGAELRGLMNADDVKGAIERKHGTGFYKALVEDVDSITGNRRARESIPGLGLVMSHLRQAATFRHLAYSVRNVVQQGTSIPIAMHEVGAGRFSSAVIRFMSPGREELRESIREKSAFMSNRASLINREASEVAKRMAINSRRGKAWRFAADNVFFFQTLVDAEVAFPTWLAKYEQQMEEHGDEVRAVSAADSSVAESVGSGSDLHLGGAFHSTQTELTRTMTLFGSWFNAYYQRIYKSSHGGDLSEADLVNLFNTVFTMPTLVGVLSAAIIADGPGDDPESEDWALWIAKQWAMFLGGTVPLLRDVLSAFRGFAPSTVWSAGGETPARLFNEISSYVEGDESGLKFSSDMLKITATVVPIPGAGNVTRAMDYTDSYLQGDEGDIFNPYQALVEGADKN